MLLVCRMYCGPSSLSRPPYNVSFFLPFLSLLLFHLFVCSSLRHLGLGNHRLHTLPLFVFIVDGQACAHLCKCI